MITARLRRKWFTLLTTIVALALVCLGVSSFMNADPTAVIPSLPLPTPNAYDYDVRAGHALVDGDKITEALSSHPAAPLPPYTLAAKEALLHENAVSLGLVRTGFGFPFVLPEPRHTTSPIYPELSKIRALARLLRLESDVYSAKGDYGQAADSDLDAIRLGEDIAHGSTEIGGLVSIACQAIGRKPLWMLAPHLSASQAESAARRLETIQGEHVPWADVMQQTEWTDQAAMLMTFRRHDWRNVMTRDTFDGMGIIGNEAARIERLRFRTQLLITSKRTLYGEYTHYMDAVVRSARAPYAAKIPIASLPLDPEHALEYKLFEADPYQSVQIKDTNDSQTQNALLMVTLALRAYRVDHGSLPDTLSVLVPTYLNRVPDDPFAFSGPIRYRKTTRDYVLYSVGPDGRDDHGTPIEDSTQPAPAAPGDFDQRRWPRDDSKGDIVAGINS